MNKENAIMPEIKKALKQMKAEQKYLFKQARSGVAHIDDYVYVASVDYICDSVLEFGVDCNDPLDGIVTISFPNGASCYIDSRDAEEIVEECMECAEGCFTNHIKDFIAESDKIISKCA